jgi:hypothetical protein
VTDWRRRTILETHSRVRQLKSSDAKGSEHIAGTGVYQAAEYQHNGPIRTGLPLTILECATTFVTSPEGEMRKSRPN